MGNFEIKLELQEKEITTAKEFNDFISGLPLSDEENSQLMHIAGKHFQAAKESGFVQGFRMGKEYTAWDSTQTGKPSLLS